MSNHVYKTVEVTGTSPDGITQAITNAVSKASQSLRNVSWFEVENVRGHVEGPEVSHYQVTIKLGFRLED